MRLVLSTVIAFLLPAPFVSGQDEIRLREALEGTTVVARIDMPATKDGIDVYPERSTPLDFRAYQQRVKANGVAVRSGESILLTRIVVKEKHIEVHLGGGGYGTFGDDTATSVSGSHEGPSKREKELSDLIKGSTGDQKKALEKEKQQLERERERNNARSEAEARQASEAAKARILQLRKEGGSRFNVRFEPRLPAYALTVDGFMAALDKWLEFRSEVESPAKPGIAPSIAPAGTSLPLLRKGSTREEVDLLLGKPVDVSEKSEGSLRVETVVYEVWGVTARVEFVHGVMTRFTYASR